MIPNIISNGILFSGLTLALLLAFAKRAARAANLFLSLALAVIVVKLAGLTPLLLPSLGPLIYLYVRQLTQPTRPFRWRDFLHFSALVVGFWMPAWLVLLTALAYLYLAHRLIEAFYKQLTLVLMDRPRFAFRRLDKALLMLGLFCLLSPLSDLCSWGVAAVLIGLAVEAIIKKDGAPVISLTLTDRYDAREKARRLKEAVAANRLYEDPELTLATLAEKLKTHPHDLSRIINTGLEKNFADFINEFRVREVVRRMYEPANDRLTLLGIAYESGFNSQRTFNRVFKEMTGKTPLEYKNELKKEWPNDKLASSSRVRPVILQSASQPVWAASVSKRNIMFKSYFKLAYRNIVRDKAYSILNVAGLAIGIAASLVIYLIIDYHFSFDKFHKDGNRIYRVVTDMTFSGIDFTTSGVPPVLYGTVQKEVAGVNQSAYFFAFHPTVKVPGGDNPAIFKNESNIVFTDPNYFALFQHQWLAGAPDVLKDPFKVALSESVARKYFPAIPLSSIIGRQVIYNDTLPFTVGGIVADWDKNSDLTFNQFASFATMKATGLKNRFGIDSWMSTDAASQLFVKLAPNTTTANILGQFKRMMNKYSPENNKNGNKAQWNLEPLNSLHFNSTYGNYGMPMANMAALEGLSAVALFLLLLGCINFINLTTAQAAQRSKEIGIRKTMGSSKKQIMLQFLIEAFLITLIATLCSVFFAPWILKLFADFIPEGVHFNLFQRPQIALFLVVITGAVTLLSGFYPALIMSGFKPIQALRNQTNANTGKSRKAWLRKSLTVSQFVIAQAFVMITILVGKQIHFVFTKDLGFRKEAILSFIVPPASRGNSGAKLALLQSQLQAVSQVSLVSIGGAPPSSGDNTMVDLIAFTNGRKNVQANVEIKIGDTNYLRLYGIPLLAGRNVIPGDSIKEFVINETYLHSLGFQSPGDIIGKKLHANYGEITIVGVMADFYPHSLHGAIQPLAFTCDYRQSNYAHVALKPQVPRGDGWRNAIAAMEKKYKQLYPKEEFNYAFFDESIAKFYKDDQSLSKLLNWAALFSIIISCLGLLGLVIYNTNQRVKEIGIRKVLGSSITQVVLLISKDFLQLVVVAFIIAVPVAWLYMQQWLQSFAYRTVVSWWIFGVSGIGMVLLAMAVLSAHVIKAASANPIKNLHTE